MGDSGEIPVLRSLAQLGIADLVGAVHAHESQLPGDLQALFEGHPERKKAERACIWVFRFVLLGMAVFGTLREAGVIWQLGDVGVGITAWINVIALLILCPRAIRALKEYEEEVR